MVNRAAGRLLMKRFVAIATAWKETGRKMGVGAERIASTELNASNAAQPKPRGKHTKGLNEKPLQTSGSG